MLTLILGICIQADTLIPLREVVVKQPTENAIGSVEQHLSKNPSVNWIRRGNYAAEPQINGLSSERNTVTLDGMRIYAACTDKMDPITSYLEITQLESARIGATHGSGIGGGLDLQMRKPGFGKEPWSGKLFSGYETNAGHRMAGYQVSTSREKWYTDLNISYRKAENYRSAENAEVKYSGFTKGNASVQLGFRPNDKQEWETGLIYDLAKDVGYPALPMDVGKAEGLITFLQYTRHLPKAHWKTRAYHNKIIHRMDDSQRPDVPVRMDMPGWSTTTGVYTQITGTSHRKATFNAHTNRSLAEMTMYAPGEKDMFMLTWPGVRTSEFDLFLEDKIPLTSALSLQASTGVSFHRQGRSADFQGLDIFFPGAPPQRNRLLTRVSGAFTFQKQSFKTSLRLGHSERAPSVSEAFGFYLFNSSDRFDYIGNPELRKEKGLQVAWSGSYQTPLFKTEVEFTSFHLRDYILGRYDPALSPMTLGAEGVKIYRNLNSATLYRFRWQGNVLLHRDVSVQVSAVKQLGRAADYGYLPFMQPLTATGSLRWDTRHLGVTLSVEAAEKQSRLDLASAERPSPAYAVMHLHASTELGPFQCRAGIENIWDTYYTTYADWNKIPRMGRNVLFNVIWNF